MSKLVKCLNGTSHIFVTVSIQPLISVSILLAVNFFVGLFA